VATRRDWFGWAGLGAITALCLLTLAFTGSRSALLGLMAAALSGAALAWPRARWLVAGIGLFLVVAVILISVQGLAARESQNSALTSAYTLRQRLAIWEAALPVVADFPYTGTGMNGFRRILPLFYPESGTLEGQEIPHAHNQLLQAALDLGLPGLVAYLAIWLLVPVVVWRGWRATRDPQRRALIAGLGLSLLAGFVFGFTDAVALGAKPGVLFWTALGLLVSAAAVLPPAATAP
jgi:putative inorganic carbon (HCO3(-)) transporter